MAGLKNIVLVLAALLLAPLTMAAPRLDVRAMYTHTDTEIVWVTVEETTTVWLDAASPTPVPVVATFITFPSSSTTSTYAIASPTTSEPAVFAQTSYSPSTMATVAAVSSPADSPAAWTSSAAAPVVESSSSAAASAAASASSVAVQAKAVSASTSGICEGQGAACAGDVTHWDGGLGACGWNVNTASDMQIALPFAFMGTLSNTNPYCGRSVTLYNPTSGTTVQATVGDKCMGCVDRAIDCTDALFNAISDGTGDGRVSGIEWWLN